MRCLSLSRLAAALLLATAWAAQLSQAATLNTTEVTEAMDTPGVVVVVSSRCCGHHPAGASFATCCHARLLPTPRRSPAFFPCWPQGSPTPVYDITLPKNATGLIITASGTASRGAAAAAGAVRTQQLASTGAL